MIKIISDYGFCYGVTRAIELLEQAGTEHAHVLLTHPLIHNLPENRRLMEKSHAGFYEEGMAFAPDTAVVLSAHGHPLEEEKPFLGKTNIIDATCPLIVRRYEMLDHPSEDVSYVFLGKANHQETLGFLSHYPFLIFVDTSRSLEQQLETMKLKKKVFFMPQTTVSEEKRSQLESLLRKEHEFVASVPICPLYQRRAKQAIEALKDKEADHSYFVVVGDQASSNAREILAAVLASKKGLQGKIALTPEDLDLTCMKGKDIYLASATSVNQDTVEALFSYLSDRLS